MKKIIVLIIILIIAIGAAATTYAAGNQADVPKGHWAYPAVAKLTKLGIIEGYSDGYFQGDKPLSRYEFAVAVAKAIDNYSKADEATKTEILKLIAEFSKELDKIEARLGSLEKNQPNLKFTGILNTRYYSTSYSQSSLSNGTATKGQFRLRLDGVAKIDDQSSFGLRIATASSASQTGKTYKWASSSYTTFGADGDTGTGSFNNTLDRIYFTRKVGTVSTTVGRQKLTLGIDSFLYDNGGYSFDGVNVAIPVDKTGKFLVNWGRAAGTGATSHQDVASVEYNKVNGKATYGLGYATVKDNGKSLDLAKYLYLYGQYHVTEKASVYSEYINNNSSLYDGDTSAYTIGVVLGDQNNLSNINGFSTFKKQAKKGDQNLKLVYYSVGKNSIPRYSSYNLSTVPSPSTNYDAIGTNTGLHNAKGFNAVYTYFLSPTFNAQLQYVNLTDKEKNPKGDLGYRTVYAFLNAYF